MTSSSPAANRIQFRLPPGSLAQLRDRAARMGDDPNSQARTELALWYATLDAELAAIRLTVAELGCIADVLAGPQLRPAITSGLRMVAAQCLEAFASARAGVLAEISSYGAKHDIDEQALVAYLASLGPAADHALADAVSRWWDRDLEPTAGGFRAVGLRARSR